MKVFSACYKGWFHEFHEDGTVTEQQGHDGACECIGRWRVIDSLVQVNLFGAENWFDSPLEIQHAYEKEVADLILSE